MYSFLCSVIERSSFSLNGYKNLEIFWNGREIRGFKCNLPFVTLKLSSRLLVFTNRRSLIPKLCIFSKKSICKSFHSSVELCTTWCNAGASSQIADTLNPRKKVLCGGFYETLQQKLARGFCKGVAILASVPKNRATSRKLVMFLNCTNELNESPK